MQRLSNGTQVLALPAPLAVSGTPGFATRGDAAAGQLASIFDADQYNRLQEELMAILTEAGVAPNAANNAQVLASITALFPRRSEFTRTQNPGVGDRIICPNFMIQVFGTPPVNLPGSGASVAYTYTFPVAFPNACLSLAGRDGGYAGFNWSAFAPATRFGGTGFVWSDVPGTGAQGAITAIGF